MKSGCLTSRIVAIIVAFAGCGKSNVSRAPSITTPVEVTASTFAPSDPCAIALAPLPTEGAADAELTRVRELARNASEPAPWVERLGWIYVAKARSTFDPGFYKLAEQAALCMDSKKPGCVEALLLRGHVLHSLHKFKEGEAVARELVAKRGLSPDYGLLGDVLMEQGRLDEAVVAYQAMMNQKPSPEAYSRAAHMRWLKGDLDGAIELMTMAAGGSSPRDRESAAWFHVRLALYQFQRGNVEQATRTVDAALSVQPDYPPALLARGRILLAQERAADAIALLQRAAALNPLPEYEWVLTEALRAVGRADEARAVERSLHQRGAEDDPRTFALYLATRGEDVGTALRLATKELQTRADVFSLDALAWTLHVAGRTAEAQALMQRALAEGTQDARLLFHASVILGTPARLEQLLLPSERKILAAMQSINPVTAISRKEFGKSQQPTQETQQ
jgi:tetratricopeptide (TPR) repeat protein